MRNLRIAGISLGLALTIAATALAQGQTFGARLGASVATLDLDAENLLEEENRTGLVAGVFYNRSFGPLGYQVEVLYAKRGADFADDGSLDLTYITIPALVKVGLPAALVQPGVFAGLALALNVDCEVGDENREACDDVEGIEVNDVDTSAVFGADVKLGLVGVSLWGDGRYYVGLSDVGDFEDVVGDVKNRSWEFTAGAGISLP